MRSAFPFCAAVGLGLCSAIVSAAGPDPGINVTVTNPPTQPVPVSLQGTGSITGDVSIASTQVTHMGRAPQEHITLGVAGGTGNLCDTGFGGFLRRQPDGGFGTGEFFVVPAHKVLIITDFGLGITRATGRTWNPGDLIGAKLTVGGSAFSTLYQTSVTVDANLADAGKLWINERVLSGIVVAAGKRPCIVAGVGFSPEPNQAAVITTLSIMHGYLMDE
jgi:hypothetical protein